MRSEMLKRLDDLIGCVAPWGVGPINPDVEYARWLVLRAELTAERCENCAHWGMTNRGDGPEPCDDELPEIFAHLKKCGGLDELRVDDYTSFYQGTATGPNFGCSHFEKKVQ